MEESMNRDQKTTESEKNNLSVEGAAAGRGTTETKLSPAPNVPSTPDRRRIHNMTESFLDYKVERTIPTQNEKEGRLVYPLTIQVPSPAMGTLTIKERLANPHLSFYYWLLQLGGGREGGGTKLQICFVKPSKPTTSPVSNSSSSLSVASYLH
eukprot:gene7583-5346_t